MTPEFAQFLPAAGRGEMKVAVGGENAGGRQHMDVRMPEEEVAEGLDGNHEARLAVGLPGAVAEPGGDRGVGGVVEVVQQGAVEFERVSN